MLLLRKFVRTGMAKKSSRKEIALAREETDRPLRTRRQQRHLQKTDIHRRSLEERWSFDLLRATPFHSKLLANLLPGGTRVATVEVAFYPGWFPGGSRTVPVGFRKMG